MVSMLYITDHCRWQGRVGCHAYWANRGGTAPVASRHEILTTSLKKCILKALQRRCTVHRCSGVSCIWRYSYTRTVRSFVLDVKHMCRVV